MSNGSLDVEEGFKDGVGSRFDFELLVALTGSPLLQINLRCFFKHVNIFPLCIAVVPNFVHFAPALGVMAIEVTGSRRLMVMAARITNRNDDEVARGFLLI